MRDQIMRPASRGAAACLVVMAALMDVAGASAQTPPAVVTTPDASGPQTAVPPARQGPADVPGGSARNGVIRPPAVGGVTPVIKPPQQGNMPVITPPGNGAVQPGVVAK